MDMRRSVVVEVHADDDAEEGRDDRHSNSSFDGTMLRLNGRTSVFELLSQCAQSDCFGPGHRFVSRAAIAHCTRHFEDFCQPSAVFLGFAFNMELLGSPLRTGVCFWIRR
jgi:hypothetical protein